MSEQGSFSKNITPKEAASSQSTDRVDRLVDWLADLCVERPEIAEDCLLIFHIPESPDQRIEDLEK